MNLGPMEIGIILLLVILLFGPGIVRRLRSTAAELRKVGSDEA